MNWINVCIGSLLLSLLSSCANRAAGPTGGLKDSIPPVVLRSVPVNGAVNFRKKEIVVYFNENITLDKVNENFIISPPQLVQPVVKANARLLTVTLEDELIDSTTYSLFFGNAVVDLNEKNPLTNFQFAFSTGNEIDTLQVSGTLHDAFNLDPVNGVFVGMHASLKDSAIYTDKFSRVTKSDEDGRFTVKNIREGKYTIYALGDANRDFMYQPGEAVAFYSSSIVPELNVSQSADTVWKDSVTIDTVRFSRRVQFMPDTINLLLFKELKKRQYLIKAERKDPRAFTVFFNRQQDSLPVLRPLNFQIQTPLLLQANLTLDSLTWWIPDSIVYSKDTLVMEVHYMKTDSLFAMVPQTDTLNLIYRKPNIAKKELAVPPLSFKSNLNSSFDLNSTIQLNFEQPLSFVDTAKIHLLHKQDSLLVPVVFEWSRNDSTGMTYTIMHTWKEGETYELKTDSAAFVSLYGVVNVPWKSNFKMKTLEDYSSLKIVLSPFDSLAVIQVLDGKETIIQQQAALVKGNQFTYLKPGDYFVKLFIDVNQNGLWDTGDLNLRRFPEKVSYFSKKLSLKANWELEEVWDYQSIPDPFQKPEDLIKKKKTTSTQQGR